MEQPNKKKDGKELPKVHEDLEGLSISVNEFGVLQTTMSIDKVNNFLNKNVEDKKLSKKSEEE